MSVGVTKGRTPQVPAWKTWNTLQSLWAALYLIWALDAVLLFVSVVGAQVHRAAVQTIGRDSAPSIIAAQSIKYALADMDANAANELLGEPGKMQDAVNAYEKRRGEAVKALIDAARNITYGREEQEPIETMQYALGTFQEEIQRARDLHERKGADYVGAYREAAKLMDSTLLPAADKLDKANADHLKGAYEAVEKQSVGSAFLVLLAGGALLWSLISVQRFLTRRMHRLLNPMLVLTTLVAFGFVAYSFVTFGSERHLLKVAKEDAFDSISALWRARAEAYAANAEESRYLLDTANAQDYESVFFARAATLLNPRDPSGFKDAIQQAEGGRLADGTTGYLVKELNNITFPGEREAATDTLRKFGKYMIIDEQIRGLQSSGKHAEALALCIGTDVDQSNWAFDQFDQALMRTIKINQDEFDHAVHGSFAELSNFEVKASIIALLIGGLAFSGLLQRIREYR